MSLRLFSLRLSSSMIYNNENILINYYTTKTIKYLLQSFYLILLSPHIQECYLNYLLLQNYCQKQMPVAVIEDILQYLPPSLILHLLCTISLLNLLYIHLQSFTHFLHVLSRLKNVLCLIPLKILEKKHKLQSKMLLYL